MNARTRVNRGTPVYGEQLPEFREAVAIAGSLSRRKLLSEGWLTLLRAVPWAAGAGLIPAAIRLLGFPFISPLYGIIPVVIVPAAAGVIRFLQRKTDTRLMLEIDADLSLRQGLVTLLELGGNGGRENPYFPVICRETAGKLRSADAKSRYPLERGKPFVRAMVLLLLFLGAGTVSLLTADPRTRLTAIPGAILSEAGKRLAAREEESGNLSVLGEELERLGEEMEGGRIDVLQAREKIEELSEEVSRQIKDLKRNDLSSMLEEKRITPDQAEMLSRMLDEELTPDEVRELVLELTSEGETGLRDREAMQKSFEDFMDNPQEGSQSLLAEDLMDRLAGDQEEEETETALNEARNALQDAAAELSPGTEGKPGAGKEIAEDSGELPGEGEGTEGGFGSAAEKGDETPENGGEERTSGPPGTEADLSRRQGTFTPFGGDQPRADLPEGTIREETKKGFLRVEPDEEFSLGMDPTQQNQYERLREKPILTTEIPDSLRAILGDYFAALGENERSSEHEENGNGEN